MDPISLLETHAQLALTLAGFASVVAALERPLTQSQRSRFLVLLSIALRQVVGCVVPIWLFAFVQSPATVWQSASALGALLLVWHLVWVSDAWRPGATQVLLNRKMNALAMALTIAIGIAFLGNSFETPIGPTFAAYYFALLMNLVVGFIIFADTLAGPSSRG